MDWFLSFPTQFAVRQSINPTHYKGNYNRSDRSLKNDEADFAALDFDETLLKQQVSSLEQTRQASAAAQ
ncbi:hypothetical protein [Bradyrhizobium sp.]|jgi:hypothetical protein|uniref:hypothetical protein n=1 Tax=Bradyrhizobium sp. TaxID=376 RepID=UPI003C223C80